MSVEIAEFAEGYAEAAIDLVLRIQRDEFGFPVNADEQPDLLDVRTHYGAGRPQVGRRLSALLSGGTMTRIFLAASALLFLPYGLFCFVQPGFLGEAAGVSAASTTGSIELRAMYGGLQAALGALALAALFRPALVRPALIAFGFVAAGLAAGRLGGVVLDGEVSPYTTMALALEITLTALAAGLLARTNREVAA